MDEVPEMVERVAIAIEALGYANGRTVMREIARAAIAAMREPTAEMVDRGRDIGPDSPYGAAETAERWRTMVDAALR